jgi:two-component system, sensor histidine kinase LadS
MVAQEAERRRLASELHDSLGQTLSLIKNRAHLARIGNGTSTAGELDAIERLVSASLTEVRGLVHNLRPLHVEQEGLTAALQGLVDEVAASTSIRFDARLEPVDDVVRGDDATHVYRIAQEALHNLVEHSGARHAKFSLERDVHCVRLRIGDDGVGFTPEHPPGNGLGLESMAERARMLGGVLAIDSRPGAGTTLRLELPIREAMQPAEETANVTEEPT